MNLPTILKKTEYISFSVGLNMKKKNKIRMLLANLYELKDDVLYQHMLYSKSYSLLDGKFNGKDKL